MKKPIISAIAAALCTAALGAGFLTSPVMAAGPVTVGGAPMYSNKNIIQNAVNSRDHTTLVAAVKAAGLVDTLSGPGPFTVFAPVNSAFDRLPAGTVPTLLRPENKGKLTGVLTYHVVPGRISAMALRGMVQRGKGRATLRTVQGEMLTVTQMGRRLLLTDAHGHSSNITIGDVNQSNGVIHVVDAVLLP